jgi:Flp pilus assembly protein TadD
MTLRHISTKHIGSALAALRRLGLALALLGVVASLAGCTTFFGGKSDFGNNALTTTDLPAVPTDTLQGNLTNARLHFRNNDFGYAAAYYKQAVDMSPKDTEAYFGLAASYDHLSRFDLSDRIYAILRRLAGGTAQFYNNLGYSYLLRGNNAAALSSFQRAAALDPTNTVIAANIAALTPGATGATGDD